MYVHVLVASTAQEVFTADRCYFAVAVPADQDQVRDRKFARRHFAPAIVDRPAKGIKVKSSTTRSPRCVAVRREPFCFRQSTAHSYRAQTRSF